jgi:hypothetical protein
MRAMQVGDALPDGLPRHPEEGRLCVFDGDDIEVFLSE